MESDAEKASSWSYLGVACSELGEHTKAIDYFKEALEIDSKFAKAWFGLGNVYLKLGEYNKAIDCFEKAVKINPEYVDAWTNLGVTYGKLGEYKKAIEYLQKALEIDSENVKARVGMGIMYSELGEHTKAIDYFKEALEIDSEFAEAWFCLGNVYGDLDEHNKAIDCFEKAVKINPEYADAWTNLGVTYSEIGEYKKGIECLQKAVKINPQDIDAWFFMGVDYNVLDDPNNAIKCYKKTLELNPEDTLAAYNLGFIQGALGKEKDIQAEVKQTIDELKGNELESKVRKLAEDFYGFTYEEDYLTLELNDAQIKKYVEEGCFKKDTKSAELDVVAIKEERRNGKKRPIILLCECKARNKPTNKKEVKCFLLKVAVWKDFFINYYRIIPTYRAPELRLWFVSLKGFTKGARELIRQNEIKVFDLEALNKELKKANIRTIPKRFITNEVSENRGDDLSTDEK